ncbi:unnamed protein product [Clavelina lepadiformis]|uniref:Uncharacterized protein n=1 Tax=Clavelina lepadiformis TaxID=159417 RepID=A0ABP0GYF6_CLALP
MRAQRQSYAANRNEIRMQLYKQERRKKFTKNEEGDERQRKTPRWYMQMKLTVHKNKVMQIMKHRVVWVSAKSSREEEAGGTSSEGPEEDG